MKLAIIGSRTATDYSLLEKAIWALSYDIDEVISGGAQGADNLGAKWATEHDIKLTEYLPDWDKYGKRAGFIRNEDIIKNADFILSIWDGQSKGTANSLTIAKRLKKPTLIVYF